MSVPKRWCHRCFREADIAVSSPLSLKMAVLRPVAVVIEEDTGLRRLLSRSLHELGFDVHAANNGQTGLIVAAQSKPDLIILDLEMLEIDGLVLMRKLREWWSTKPIIVLSERNSELDEVMALDLGADDYVAKPFGLPGLLARVRAVMRRASRHPHADNALQFRSHEVTVDMLKRKVSRNGSAVKLTRSEYRVLSILVKSGGLLVRTDTLVNELWGPRWPPTRRSCLRTYMASLRKKLEKDPASPVLLLTEPGFGYRVSLDPQEGI